MLVCVWPSWLLYSALFVCVNLARQNYISSNSLPCVFLVSLGEKRHFFSRDLAVSSEVKDILFLCLEAWGKMFVCISHVFAYLGGYLIGVGELGSKNWSTSFSNSASWTRHVLSTVKTHSNFFRTPRFQLLNLGHPVNKVEDDRKMSMNFQSFLRDSRLLMVI